MHEAVAYLSSTSPYSQSRHLTVPKKPRELERDYEERVWRERCHWDEQGFLVIPPMAFKKCLESTARYLKRQIPGQGKATYTKHFERSVMCLEGITLPLTRDTIEGEWLLLPSDGTSGGGRRVAKCLPLVPQWEGQVSFALLDDIITEEEFTYTLRVAGQLTGIGMWRPEKAGLKGRFRVERVEWKPLVLEG